MLILIIGGRFGGNYVADTNKSIVNAEYAAARSNNIPVFTFVKSNVVADHHVYQKNKNNNALPQIIFPSIENNQHASKIFDFINEVRSSPVNNGFFSFEFARDITILLRKQWAGMFYQFLEHRSAADQMATANKLLKNIAIAGDKVEELVKGLYRHIDTAGAEAKINSVEKRSAAKRFFEDMVGCIEDTPTALKITAESWLKFPLEGRWYDYLALVANGKIEKREFTFRGNAEREVVVIDWGSLGLFVDCPKDKNDPLSIRSRERQELFDLIKHLPKEELRQILNEIDHPIKKAEKVFSAKRSPSSE